MFVSACMGVSGWAKDVGQSRIQEEVAVWKTGEGKVTSQSMEQRSEQKAKSEGKNYTDNLGDSRSTQEPKDHS